MENTNTDYTKNAPTKEDIFTPGWMEDAGKVMHAIELARVAWGHRPARIYFMGLYIIAYDERYPWGSQEAYVDEIRAGSETVKSLIEKILDRGFYPTNVEYKIDPFDYSKMNWIVAL